MQKFTLTMHDNLKDIPARIIEVAKGALTQANTHAVYYDLGKEHWDHMSILNTALAGELFLKAIIAREHPLLIFRDLFHLEEPSLDEIDINRVIEKGRTYSFEQLPKLLWVTTGERLPDMESFEKIRSVRNSIQHFCAPDQTDFRALSLEFIYKNIDPLIHRHFDLYAIEYNEDPSVGYDYVVACLIARELLFSVPSDFEVMEIDFEASLSGTSDLYREKLFRRIEAAVKQ